MAIRIIASLSKKLPLPGKEFSSQQASIEISAEVQDLSQIAAEAQRLYQVAEAAVDQQLGITQSEAKSPPTGGTHVTNPGPRAATTPPLQASQPYPVNGQRRGPAPVTDSQLRFLKKLIDKTKTSVPAVLEHHQVGGLDQLSCKAGAELIDELKARTSA